MAVPVVRGERNAMYPEIDDRNEEIQTPDVEIVEPAVNLLSCEEKCKSDGDKNLYLANKSVVQGMMDIALLTANANQLKFVLQYCKGNDISFVIMVTLISLSIIIQVIVGTLLIFKGRRDYKKPLDEKKRKEKEEHSIRMNNIIVVLIFFVTIINVFIAAFSTDAT